MEWNKNMKIQTKLVIGFTLVDLLIVAVMIIGFQTVSKMVGVDAATAETIKANYRNMMFVMFLVAIMLMTGIAFGILNGMRKAFKRISIAADKLVVGEIEDIELKKNGNDEFGHLIDDFQKVVDTMKIQAQLAVDLSNGNMMIDITPNSEKDLLGNSLKKMIEGNRNSIRSICDSTFQISTSASEVASASEALAQGSTEQASAIEEITASITDVAEKTKKNAEEANEASDLVTKAIVDVKRGNEQMKEMIHAMNDINESSESISKIIKVIDDIAFQTNILALNAAVEAARAGEAGKGFAVVAEEVRNLAAKSASAAAETAELIEDSIRKVEVGSGIAGSTAKALEEITSAVEETGNIIVDIAEASNYQATAIAQVDQALGQVSQVVQNNSATSEECAAASVELSNQASNMRDMLSEYNVGEAYKYQSTGSSRNYASRSERNEQIISLKDGFGKY